MNLSVRDIMQRTGVKRADTVYAWCNTGVVSRATGERVLLGHQRAGTRYLITEADLDAFLAECAGGAAEPPQQTTQRPRRRRGGAAPARDARVALELERAGLLPSGA